jgi:hypothetical protein
MQNLTLPHSVEPREILTTAINRRTPAIMTYLADRRWHVAKVIFTELGANKLYAELLLDGKPRPINIRDEQPVGISLKHNFGKLVFDTKVVSLEPSLNSASGGAIIFAVPAKVEIIQRRSYYRVPVPSSLKVNVVFWHRDQNQDENRHKPCADCKTFCKTVLEDKRYWQAQLADISAGGAQIVIDASQKAYFRKGQFLTIRFTALPYEMPLMFNVQIRNILPTVNNQALCLGLQIVGLEASSEGHETLQRLCTIVEQYYKMNQTPSQAKDPQPVENCTQRVCEEI